MFHHIDFDLLLTVAFFLLVVGSAAYAIGYRDGEHHANRNK